jgi:hypothetical protein
LAVRSSLAAIAFLVYFRDVPNRKELYILGYQATSIVTYYLPGYTCPMIVIRHGYLATAGI